MYFNDGFSYTNIIEAGTTTLINTRKGVLHSVVISQPYVGTVILSSGTGTIATIGTPSVTDTTLLFDARVKDGLTAVATGTPNLTVIYK
jgi:hypothetical protein